MQNTRRDHQYLRQLFFCIVTVSDHSMITGKQNMRNMYTVVHTLVPSHLRVFNYLESSKDDY